MARDKVELINYEMDDMHTLVTIKVKTKDMEYPYLLIGNIADIIEPLYKKAEDIPTKDKQRIIKDIVELEYKDIKSYLFKNPSILAFVLGIAAMTLGALVGFGISSALITLGIASTIGGLVLLVPKLP